MSHLLFQLKNASLWRWASQMFCTWTLKVRRVLPSAHIIASHCPSHTDKGRDVAILILKEHHLKPSILTQSSPLSSKGGGGIFNLCFRKPDARLLFLFFSKAFHGWNPLAVQLDFYFLFILVCTWEDFFDNVWVTFIIRKRKIASSFIFSTSSIPILLSLPETSLGLFNIVTTWAWSVPAYMTILICGGLSVFLTY